MTFPTMSIIGGGMACPLGLRSATALAAMRAGISVVDCPDEDEDLTLSRLSTLNPEATRTDRILGLLRYALAEALDQPHGWPSSMPLFMAFPDPTLGKDCDEQRILHEVRTMVSGTTGTQLMVTSNQLVHDGRAGLFTLLQRAAQTLAAGQYDVALIGAVDSLVDPGTVTELGSRGVLLGASNLDGRMLGEAAGFVLVASPHLRLRYELAQITAVATDHEAACFTEFLSARAIPRGEGLTRVFQHLGGCVTGRTDAVFSAQPSEGYWGTEFSYAYLRNIEIMPEPLYHRCAGVEIGDSGAAAGIMAVFQALDEFRPRGRTCWQPRRSALVYGASDQGALGGCVLVSADLK